MRHLLSFGRLLINSNVKMTERFTIMVDDKKDTLDTVFSGSLYIFHAFDVGDDINIEKVKSSGQVIIHPLPLSKYFKNYHIPLVFDLPEEAKSKNHPFLSGKIHNFGAVSFIYKIPFKDTLEGLRKDLESIDRMYDDISLLDIENTFKRLKPYIGKPFFFHTRSSYVLIQIDPMPELFDTVKLKDLYGGVIASTLRFETESLSEVQKDEILASAIGYYRGDFVVVDTDAIFIYDDEYQDTVEFIEFANVQHCELRYFDRTLDQQLNYIYEGRTREVPVAAFLPFVGTLSKGPIDDLSKLKVDISVVAERLEGSIKLAGEPYYSELYSLLVEKRELKNLREAIDKKLSIIKDVVLTLQKKVDAAREDILTVSIIVLICIELVIGMLDYLK